MPIYEFYCPENHRIYSFLAPSISFRNKIPRCPANGDFTLQKRVSQFAIGGRNQSEGEDDPLAGIDDAKLASMMEEIEGELSGLDEDHPNPRKLGKAMRKMAGLMGGDAGGAMEEMISRLERGEDPEALEAELGDALDGGDGDDFELGAALKKMRDLSKAAPPSRDPTIYDMKEWV